jgi:hypothetical protein
LIPAAIRNAERTELAAEPGAVLKTTEKLPLSSAETHLASNFDLRSWFELAHPGFYWVRLTSPENKPEEEARGKVRFLRSAASDM